MPWVGGGRRVHQRRGEALMGQHSRVCSRLSGRSGLARQCPQPSGASGSWSGPHRGLSPKLSANCALPGMH